VLHNLRLIHILLLAVRCVHFLDKPIRCYCTVYLTVLIYTSRDKQESDLIIGRLCDVHCQLKSY